MFWEVLRLSIVVEGSHKRFLSAYYVMEDAIKRTKAFAAPHRKKVRAAYHEKLKTRLDAIKSEAWALREKSCQAYDLWRAEGAVSRPLEAGSDSSIKAFLGKILPHFDFQAYFCV